MIKGRVKTTLRLDEKLYDKVQKESDKLGISINALITLQVLKIFKKGAV